MSSAIGIRVYKIYPYKKGRPSQGAVRLQDREIDSHSFLAKFIEARSTETNDKETARVWWFDKVVSETEVHHGIIKYGAYGFESDLVDGKTRSRNYKRKENDIEIIPLYYQFWTPEKSEYSLIALQSFSGRSCVSKVLDAMRAEYSDMCEDLALDISKLMPTGQDSELFKKAPVKTLRLTKNSASNDIVDRYAPHYSAERVDLEVKITAKSRGNLGILKDFAFPAENQKGLVELNGVKYDTVKADIKVGGKRRPVTVFGVDSDAGVIDITDDVETNAGHPKFTSISAVTNDILDDYHLQLLGL
ncbi:MAG: hypothetical protein AAGH90_06600 [Pseudomonadota bacterium]